MPLGSARTTDLKAEFDPAGSDASETASPVNKATNTTTQVFLRAIPPMVPPTEEFTDKKNAQCPKSRYTITLIADFFKILFCNPFLFGCVIPMRRGFQHKV